MTSRVVVSLFSGAGGLSTGFAAAGLCPALAVENNEDAVTTYRANVSEAVINADIGQDAEHIIAEARRRAGGQNVFAVIGGPPCQGFSTAGSKNACDPRNALVFSYFDIVAALNPDWFLFENVEGLLTSDSGNAVVGLAKRFAELGYSFRIDKINFAQWGVPQARKRVLIAGNRHGIPIQLPPATHAFDGKKHRASRGSLTLSVGEAIAGLPMQTARSVRAMVRYSSPEPQSHYDASMRTADNGPLAHISVNFERDAERIRMLKPGQSLRNLPLDMWPASFRSRAFRRVADGIPTERRGGAPAGLRRLVADHPSLTITSFSSRELIHPVADRPLTLRECARLQTFPDHYDFKGGFQSVSNQIGNAFPPQAARLLADWLLRLDGAASNSALQPDAKAPAGLIGYHLTDASQMSPALQRTDERLRELIPSGKLGPMRTPRRPSTQPSLFGTEQHTRLGPEDRKVISDGRVLGKIELSDRELTRLIAVILRDLGHLDLIPQWADDIPASDYYDIDLKWFSRDRERPFDFGAFFISCCEKIPNFRVIFRCITKLHRHRLKFELILGTQPLPTMEQVARRGLLEHGTDLPLHFSSTEI